MYSTDENLVSQTLAGDRDAFGVLVHKYQDLVYTYAFQKVRSEADSQDITQEVFLRAYRHLYQLRHPHRFRSWLYTIMSNECNRWLARVTKKRQREIALEDATDDALQVEPAHIIPTEGWEVDLEQAISALPDDNRVAVSMYYMGDCSLKEISEFLGVSVNTVKGKLYRARQQLGSAMSEHYGRYLKSHKLRGGFLMQLMEQIRYIPFPKMTFAWSSATISKMLFSIITALCVLIGLIGGRDHSLTGPATNQIGVGYEGTDRWTTPIEVALLTPSINSTRSLIPIGPAQAENRPSTASNRESTERGHRMANRGSVSGNRGAKNAKPQLAAVAAKGAGEKLIYSGRVVDSDRGPVAGAEVLYSVKFNSSESVTRTAADGTFHFEFPRPDGVERDKVSIVATHPNHAIGWRNLPLKTTMEVVIQLGTPGVISGRILDAASDPIQNAEARIKSLFSSGPISSDPIIPISWELFAGSDIISIIPPAKTDANGEFVFRRLPPDVTASLVIQEPGFAKEMRYPVPTGAQGLEFRLKREARIEGQLSYAGTGAPVESATIALLRISPLTVGVGPEQASVDENGNYFLKNIAPGMYNLYLNEGPEGWTAASNEFIKIVEGQTVSNLDLTLVRGGYITGRVTDQDTKEPIANHHISFHDSARPEFGHIGNGTRTDETGAYHFRAAPGRVLVSTFAPQGYQDIGQVTRYVNVVEAETVTFDFQFSKGTELTGRVLTEAGEPVAGARVTDGRELLKVYGTSDEQGAFTVRGLRIGKKLALKAEHSELELRGTAEVEVQPGVSVEIRMERYERVKVTGRVVNRAGESIPSVNINLLYLDRQSGMGFGTTVTVTDGDGRFQEIELIVGDEYTISANAEGYWKAKTETFTATAEMTQIADLILLPAVGQFFIEGRITDTSGQPVHGARVSTHHQSQGWETFTDENGNYRFDNLLMAVINSLKTYHPEYAYHGFKMLKTNQRHDLVLIKGDGYLAGKVVDGDGEPINRATVRVEAEEDFSGYIYTSTSTNALGEFELKHIKDPIVSIYVGNRRDYKIFKDIAVNQRDLVLTLTPTEPRPEPTPEQQAERSYSEACRERFKTLVNRPAPELTVAEWLSGPPVSVEDMKGKTVALHFWTLNHNHHVRQIRLLQILQEVYRDKGLVCVAICPAAVDVETIKQHIADQSLSYAIGLDRPTQVVGAKGETSHQYAVGWGIPFVLIDTAGEITRGAWEHDLEAQIQILLAD